MSNNKRYTPGIYAPVRPSEARNLATNWPKGTIVRAVFDTLGALGALDDQAVLKAVHRGNHAIPRR